MKRFFAHFGFSFALALLVANLIETKYVIALTIGLAIIFIVSLVIKKYRQALAVPLSFGTALFACLLFLFTVNNTVAPQIALNDTKANISFYIVDLEQENSNGTYSYIAKTISINSENAPQNIKLRINSDEQLEADYYQVVNATVTFYSISDNAYSSYGYWGDNVFLSASVNSVNSVGDLISTPMRKILHLRLNIIDFFNNIIKGNEGALSCAFITGDKSSLSQLVYNYFKIAGATHIMAVSGMHLSVVAGMMLFLLKRLRVPDKINVLFTLALTMFYIALAGFTASVVRAGIMLAVVSFGKLINRRGDGINSLGFATFIICLNPFAVCDMSAVLSIVSVLAILTLFPAMIKPFQSDIAIDYDFVNLMIYTKSKTLRWFGGFFMGIAILVYTLPVMYLIFGYVSIVSPISALIVVPLSGVAMLLSLLTYLVSFAKISVVTAVFSFVVRKLNQCIIAVVRFLASFKNSTIHMNSAFGLAIAGIMILFAVCFILNNSVLFKKAFVLSLAVLVCFCSAQLFVNQNCAEIYISDCGAVVVSYNDVTVVSGITNSSSYYEAYSYLFAKSKNIDYLIVNDGESYNVSLTQNVYTNTLLTDDFVDCILENGRYEHIEVLDDYSVSLADDFDLYYHKGAYLLEINGCTFSSGTQGKDSTVALLNDYDIVKDLHGVAELSDGDLIYTFSGANTFSVRRINVW